MKLPLLPSRHTMHLMAKAAVTVYEAAVENTATRGRPMSMAHQPTLRKPGDGRTIAVVGDVYRFLATGEDTDGKYALWEAIVPPD